MFVINTNLTIKGAMSVYPTMAFLCIPDTYPNRLWLTRL